ncbi:invertebrate-type lysozyme 3-like [Drosophila nasuta]|uniref:invertebrate-type lysozyme 3-like n=1 Tax=Drosophila nasuta TaxID=42062 RepID=UPI00295E365B|nr:invertebrate-type lysozyme 3-like [Drosophila nasuta]
MKMPGLFFVWFLCICVCLPSAVLGNGNGYVLDKPVTELCLNCLCEALSECNATAICINPKIGTCGIFRITNDYWVDAGKLTINGEHPDTEHAFINCANDPHCAADTIQNYMHQFNQDCNGDGEMDCHDYARIHMLGGFSCEGELPYFYQSKFEECIENYQEQGFE